jgi:hypothetical protein
VPLRKENGITQMRFAEGVKGDIKGLIHSFDEFLKALLFCSRGCTDYFHHWTIVDILVIGFDVFCNCIFGHLDIPSLSEKKNISKPLTSILDFIRDALHEYK